MSDNNDRPDAEQDADDVEVDAVENSEAAEDVEPDAPDDQPDADDLDAAPTPADAPTGAEPAPPMFTRLVGAVRAHPWVSGIVALGGVASIAVILVALFALGGDDDPSSEGPDVEVAAVTIDPRGDEVARLAPIVLNFKDAPTEQDPARLVSLTPTVEGAYVWSEDRKTLLFQPTFPGLTRGSEYLVSVDGTAAGLDDDVTQSFTVEGKLQVDYLIPGDGDREVPVGAPILVQFNRAVVPLTVISELDTSTVLSFEPAVSGKGEWLSTSLYRFQADGFDPSTEYTVTVEPGLTSAVDGVLEEAVAWTFNTVSPAVDTVTPGQNTKFIPRDQQIEVTFNQSMLRSSVEAGFRLLDADVEAVDGSFAWTAEGDQLTFTPAVPLLMDTAYEVRVPAGLESATAGVTAKERQSTFQTAPEATVVRTSPSDGQTNARRWGIDIEFAAPIDVDIFEGVLSVSGFDDDDLRLDSYDGTTVFIQNNLDPDTEYTVTLGEGALDRQGLPVPPFEFSFETGSLDKAVSLAVPHRYVTYAASSVPELFFFATNVEEVEFELYEISETRALSRMSDPWKDFTLTGDPIRTWSVPVEGPANTPRLSSTLLSEDGPLPTGHYAVRPVAPFSRNNAVAFSVVDVAMVTKLAERELLVWALDYDTGEPLAGVEVVASGPGLIGAATVVRTNASGLATYEVPTLIEVNTNRSRNYNVLINDADHFGVVRTEWEQGAEPWQIGIQQEYAPRVYVGHIYTDRPIYRPGETVSLKGVVRADNDADYRVPDERPDGLELVIRGADYDEIEVRSLDLNDFGTFAEEFELPEDADVGFYRLELRYDQGAVRQNWQITATAFTVAEFRVPEFRVEASADRADVVAGEQIDGSAEASFFFGGAVAGADMEWSAIANPTSIRSEAFPGYSFSDFDYWATSIVEDRLRGTGSGVTDATGTATFSLPAELRGNEGTQSFEVSVSVQDESAQLVAANTSVTVHPAAFYGGVRPEGYLAIEDEPTTIHLASVDLEGAPLANRELVLKVYEREWVTTKEQTSGGGRFYRSEPVDTLVATLPATTDADAEATVTYTPDQPGTLRFVVEATDARGRVARASRFMWVAGGNFVRWQVRNDDVFELIADAEEYEPGDTAEVLVPTSYPGAQALVTLERGHIIDRETRVLSTASDVLSIPILEGHVPNVFVSVVVYRPPTEADPLPRYQVGYVELPVSTESRQLVVNVAPMSDRAGPGDTVEYEIEVTDVNGVGQEAELSIAVVDEAVLSLADDLSVDGLRAFWFERGLSVHTGSSLSVSVERTNDVIQEPEGGGKGGGSDSDALRSEFRNTAFWSGQVQTDENGRATVEFELPDNLTTWRASVRAVSGDTMVGDGQAELLVTRPLLARPALPRFLRVGDDVTLRVLMRNGTESASEVTVTLDVDGVTVTDPGPRTRTVAADASIEFAWPAQALTAGDARIRFSATDEDGRTDIVELTIPVLLDVTPEATATGGVVTDETLAEAVYLPDYALTEDGRVQVRVEASIVGVLSSELRHFSIPSICGRPCESTTSIASRMMAYAAIARAEGTTNQSRSLITRGDVLELERRQRSDNGWSWCAGTCTSDPSVTAWAVIALTEARDAGIEVNATRLNRARGYLNLALGRATDVAAENDASWRAMIRYATVRVAPTLGSSQVRALFEQERTQLQNWGRAFMILALQERSDDPLNIEVIEALTNDLAVNAISSANGSHWEDPIASGLLQSDTRTTALVLRAMASASPDHPLIEETVRWLVVARSADGWNTRLERAQALDALGTYAERTGELLGDFTYEVSVDGAELLAGEFRPRGGENEAETETPLDDLTLGGFSRFLFDRDLDAPGRLYYSLNLLYQTPAQEIESLNRGIAVSREYTLLDEPERPISAAPLGEVVRIRLTVLSEADRKFVTLEDALPAGLEPIDPQLKIIPAHLVDQLNEERRDAILGDAPEYAAPWFPWYLNPWDDVQIRDERLVLFSTRLSRGVHEYIFFARATTPGDFFVAPAVAQEEFFPEVFGRSDSTRFTVEDN